MTFIEFILNEDITTDIANLRTQIDALDMKKAKFDDMHNKQKMRLQQLIQAKQKQAANQPKPVV